MLKCKEFEDDDYKPDEEQNDCVSILIFLFSSGWGGRLSVSGTNSFSCYSYLI